MKLVIDIDEEELNRIRHFCSFGCDNIPLGWYEIAKSKPLQTELEKIKADIRKRLNPNEDFQLGILTAINVINYHISELKGENK